MYFDESLTPSLWWCILNDSSKAWHIKSSYNSAQCVPWIRAKQTWKSFRSSNTKTTKKLEKVHSDVCGQYLESQNLEISPIRSSHVHLNSLDGLTLKSSLYTWHSCTHLNFYPPIFSRFQNVRGVSPLLRTSYFLPDVIFGIITALVMARIIPHYRTKFLFLAGLPFLVSAPLIIVFSPAQQPYRPQSFPAVSPQSAEWHYSTSQTSSFPMP
jgi:hypothetical protein